MTADLGFVTHAAERHANEVAAGGLGDGLAERGFTDARRTDEAEDGPANLVATRLHGEVFEDAFLHLLEAVVIGIENVLRVLEIAHDFLLAAPGQRDHPVEVVTHDGGLGRHRGHLAELLHFLFGLGASLFRHGGVGDLLFKLADLVTLAAAAGIAVAKLALDRLHLLVEIVLALRLLHLPLHAVADLALHLEHADLAFHQREDYFSRRSVTSMSSRRASLSSSLIESWAGDRVGQVAGVGDRGDRADGFGRDLAVEFNVAVELLDDRAHESGGLFAIDSLLVDLRMLGGVVVALVDELFETRAVLAFDQHFDSAVRQLQ